MKKVLPTGKRPGSQLRGEIPFTKYVKSENGLLEAHRVLNDVATSLNSFKELKTAVTRQQVGACKFIDLIEQEKFNLVSNEDSLNESSQAQQKSQDEDLGQEPKIETQYLQQLFHPQNRRTKYLKQISPMIFTKKAPLNTAKQRRNQPEWVCAFENILSLVVQLYYKMDMNPENSSNKGDDIKKEPKRTGRRKNVDSQDTGLENGEARTTEEREPVTVGKYSQLQQDILDMLISPLRQDLPFEKWSMKEIAVFECAICRYGKKFDFIAELVILKGFKSIFNLKLGSKNVHDVISFYFCWKFTTHYKIWKTRRSYILRDYHNS